MFWWECDRTVWWPFFIQNMALSFIRKITKTDFLFDGYYLALSPSNKALAHICHTMGMLALHILKNVLVLLPTQYLWTQLMSSWYKVYNRSLTSMTWFWKQMSSLYKICWWSLTSMTWFWQQINLSYTVYHAGLWWSEVISHGQLICWMVRFVWLVS